jgi:hypothetical protein
MCGGVSVAQGFEPQLIYLIELTVVKLYYVWKSRLRRSLLFRVEVFQRV